MLPKMVVPKPINCFPIPKHTPTINIIGLYAVDKTSGATRHIFMQKKIYSVLLILTQYIHKLLPSCPPGCS